MNPVVMKRVSPSGVDHKQELSIKQGSEVKAGAGTAGPSVGTRE